MQQRDAQAWEAIASGERAATWADFLGRREDAPYLTEAGGDLLLRMARDFHSWFGGNWISIAIGLRETARIPWLARFSPVMTTRGDQGAAAAFVELVRWWAALRSQAA